MAPEQEDSQEESRTIHVKILVHKQSNKVVFVEAKKDFVDTLFSFLSLPLGTIVRLLATNNNNNDQQQHQQLLESSPFLDNIKYIYQTVQDITSNDVWNNPLCKQMLLHPRNPCESQCMKLFLNIDDTEPSSKFYVCDSCFKFTTFQNLDCTCGKPTNRQPRNLDSKRVDAQNQAFLRENGSTFLVFDDLKIVQSSAMTTLSLLKELGYSDLTQLEEITHNIDKQEILNLLKYSLTSHEPMTNTILKSSSKYKGNLPNQSSSAEGVKPCASGGTKMDVKVVRSISQKKIIFVEANGDFVGFIFSFLTMPLGSIVKLLDGNSIAGCVGNLYKSVEKMDSSLCTNSRTVLLNPGVAPYFGCPNQPLNIPDLQPPTTYYYGTGTPYETYNYSLKREVKVEGGVISKTKESIFNARLLTALDPKSPNMSREGVVGFVQRLALYGVGDDLKVKSLSANSFLLYLKELSLPIEDLQVEVISIGEAEALSFLKAFLTAKFTLTSGLGNLLDVPKLE
ncbi:uncharacterized protein [Medicago truncatula]|uniref:DUF674 family protein n=1 Tax=Medicago truncatula TaxID=3880 RepID=G7JQ77_MEDTR|nr:uncharacterized protein LOC11422751 [Medicago truncatula]XP_024636785.1 uncharacterized protein LOC11422751 [Medicago truncatula]AES86953.1 DUF674 family protein [Medicago truncatula]